ncbi:methyltransferase type 12 [Amycolatopsis sp. WAC 04182]|uniref:class I SAM-dependent methyltransferase n=1 Tax=Amycolatopsis sp. WAC 04182 TaxID=2203198 RepID=UPI000F769BC0|nr:class I SAM-dependent methyltransferase [Amycolatopsis sp. WAC 04182]RSN53543.1 methyltransferase type 12 [Amycolatopsis sp. WAC 04182]
MTETQAEFNQAKKNFDEEYVSEDPHAYYAAMRKVNYQIPQNANHFLVRVMDEIRTARRLSEVSVLDIGCSYGVNAALLKYELTLDVLYEYYAGDRRGSSAQDDRKFFSRFQERPGVRVHGIDISRQAIDYAREVRLLDSAIAVNLEEDSVPVNILQTLPKVDLIISTGCIGYVTHRTFARVLDHLAPAEPPWIAVTALRTLDFAVFEEHFERYGLFTERLAGPLRQREIANGRERAAALAATDARCERNPTPEELGFLAADLYLSLPGADAARREIIHGAPGFVVR